MSYSQTAIKGTNESVNLEKTQKGIGSLTFDFCLAVVKFAVFV